VRNRSDALFDHTTGVIRVQVRQDDPTDVSPAEPNRAEI
jgi:hypothetical protein